MSKIPNYPLVHNKEMVSFAIRSMEQIDEEADSQSDLPHRHNYYTIIWVKSGKGIHHVDFKSYDLEDQCLFFVTPGQVHQLVPKSTPTGVVILFNDEFLSRHGIDKKLFVELNLFEDCSDNPPIKLSNEDVSFLSDLSQSMFQEYEHKDQFSYEAIAGYLRLLLIRCHRIQHYTKQPVLGVDSHNYLIKDFKDLVEKYFKSKHKVQDYASQLSVTANHLNEVIKLAIGSTAKEYIQNRIILEAKRLAHYSDFNAKQAGFELGFEDPSHFGKFFKNCVGTSFSDFREQIR